MSWLITGSQKTIDGTLTLGQAFGGGYFAGYISHTADGNPTHALIVAPRATGATGAGYTPSTTYRWKTTNTSTANTSSLFNGKANTDAMIAAGLADHPAAQFCTNLTIGGYADWYLPSVLELDIAYQELKPTTQSNSTSFGVNAYSVPKRAGLRSSSFPGQTQLTLFNTASEKFEGRHWSSTEVNAGAAYDDNFTDGNYFAATNYKTDGGAFGVRAFRRIAL
jgi:hypothetical protein